MKKIFIYIIAIFSTLTLSACSSSSASNHKNDTSAKVVQNKNDNFKISTKYGTIAVDRVLVGTQYNSKLQKDGKALSIDYRITNQSDEAMTAKDIADNSSIHVYGVNNLFKKELLTKNNVKNLVNNSSSYEYNKLSDEVDKWNDVQIQPKQSINMIYPEIYSNINKYDQNKSYILLEDKNNKTKSDKILLRDFEENAKQFNNVNEFLKDNV
ncbi:hypothetical protein MOO46_00535 [Apilactobacillus apisilvae]|uniref:DUF5067 domain-containing protein n=1 Tax=Apilactobacillus apisilvae TaxID=2923364 RepID=A0ABY4PHN9_9LACO|nr:hypothetical protein [Apilactobacillus apisilvae]UQS85127.1 hypothetical protein MOO46_00535 [Apilactobacillus apisilvae]